MIEPRRRRFLTLFSKKLTELSAVHHFKDITESGVDEFANDKNPLDVMACLAGRADNQSTFAPFAWIGLGRSDSLCRVSAARKIPRRLAETPRINAFL
jgi:hypothetical protein